MKRTDEFRAFYDEHFRFAWGVLRRLGAPDDELFDLLQEVFLVAYRKLPEFQGRSKPTTWLFSICHNVLRSSRRRRRDKVRSQDHGGQPVAAPRAEDVLWARELLQDLPEEQRVVFVLFELEGLSGEEIAEAISIPVGTVRSRLRLARQTFRRRVATALQTSDGVEYRHV